jgi:glycosyltransferase involved in cell wall biosynthesis
MNRPKPHVCFLALKVYSALSGRQDVRHIGGAEVQQTLVARGLRDRGYRVSFITLDYGQPDAEDHDGIRVFRAYRLDAGLPGLRFIHPRATKVWAAMRRADADVYYQRTSDPLTGLAAAFCLRYGKPFVFAVGAVEDCVTELPRCPSLRERVPYRWGLRHATAVIAQTQMQQRQLRDNFGVEAVVIRSCTAEPMSIATRERNATRSAASPERDGRGDQSPRVLWIGRFIREKRFGLLLDAAERCPGIMFDVIGDGPPGSETSRLRQRAAALSNVRLSGYVPHAEMPAQYQGARAVVCTSTLEGFPNTFLEAWARGIPVVTTFDPDGLVQHHGLGLQADDANALAAALRQICDNDALHARLATAARAYYLAHHTVEATVSAYDILFTQTVKARSGAPVLADAPECCSK